MSTVLSADALSELVASIYDCALDPAGWPSTLHAIRRALNFDNASMDLLDVPSSRVLLHVADGIDEAAWNPEYAADVIEQWGGPQKALSYELNEPQVLSRVNPQGLTDENRYYREWASPRGIIDVVAFFLVRDTESVGTLGMGRHKDAGPVTEHDVSAARLILPHLQRAVAISRLLDIRAVTASTLTAVFNTLTAAVFLIDGERRVVHANTAAEQLLASGDLLQNKSGRLTVRSPGADKALAAAVAQAVSNEGRIGRQGFNVPVRQVDGNHCVLHVLPIGTGTLRSGVMPRAVAAVFVAPARASRLTSIKALAALFGLTSMEERVMERVANAETNEQIAASLGIAVSTVRTHLLHVFQKAGVRRQAELVALVASFELPLASSGNFAEN